MTALFDVSRWAAKAADEEVPEARFGAGEIVRRIHRSEDVVAGDLRVERTDEAGESLLADALVDVFLVQQSRIKTRDRESRVQSISMMPQLLRSSGVASTPAYASAGAGSAGGMRATA